VLTQSMEIIPPLGHGGDAMVQKAPESGKVDRPRVERVAAATHGGFRYLNDITNGKPLPSNLAW